MPGPEAGHPVTLKEQQGGLLGWNRVRPARLWRSNQVLKPRTCG